MIKKTLLGLLAALLIAIGFTAGGATVTATPDSNPVITAVAPQAAQAAWGTSVTHASNDAGYSADIHVVCNSGKHIWLSPGQGTAFGTGPSCTLSGVDRIVVGYNQTVYCKNLAPPYENTYYYTGSTGVPSNRTYKCYMQRPL